MIQRTFEPADAPSTRDRVPGLPLAALRSALAYRGRHLCARRQHPCGSRRHTLGCAASGRRRLSHAMRRRSVRRRLFRLRRLVGTAQALGAHVMTGNGWGPRWFVVLDEATVTSLFAVAATANALLVRDIAGRLLTRRRDLK